MTQGRTGEHKIQVELNISPFSILLIIKSLFTDQKAKKQLSQKAMLIINVRVLFIDYVLLIYIHFQIQCRLQLDLISKGSQGLENLISSSIFN